MEIALNIISDSLQNALQTWIKLEADYRKKILKLEKKIDSILLEKDRNSDNERNEEKLSNEIKMLKDKCHNMEEIMEDIIVELEKKENDVIEKKSEIDYLREERYILLNELESKDGDGTSPSFDSGSFRSHEEMGSLRTENNELKIELREKDKMVKFLYTKVQDVEDLISRYQTAYIELKQKMSDENDALKIELDSVKLYMSDSNINQVGISEDEVKPRVTKETAIQQLIDSYRSESQMKTALKNLSKEGNIDQMGSVTMETVLQSFNSYSPEGHMQSASKKLSKHEKSQNGMNISQTNMKMKDTVKRSVESQLNSNKTKSRNDMDISRTNVKSNIDTIKRSVETQLISNVNENQLNSDTVKYSVENKLTSNTESNNEINEDCGSNDTLRRISTDGYQDNLTEILTKSKTNSKIDKDVTEENQKIFQTEISQSKEKNIEQLMTAKSDSKNYFQENGTRSSKITPSFSRQSTKSHPYQRNSSGIVPQAKLSLKKISRKTIKDDMRTQFDRSKEVVIHNSQYFQPHSSIVQTGTTGETANKEMERIKSKIQRNAPISQNSLNFGSSTTGKAGNKEMEKIKSKIPLFQNNAPINRNSLVAEMNRVSHLGSSKTNPTTYTEDKILEKYLSSIVETSISRENTESKEMENIKSKINSFQSNTPISQNSSVVEKNRISHLGSCKTYPTTLTGKTKLEDKQTHRGVKSDAGYKITNQSTTKQNSASSALTTQSKTNEVVLNHFESVQNIPKTETSLHLKPENIFSKINSSSMPSFSSLINAHSFPFDENIQPRFYSTINDKQLGPMSMKGKRWDSMLVKDFGAPQFNSTLQKGHDCSDIDNCKCWKKN